MAATIPISISTMKWGMSITKRMSWPMTGMPHARLMLASRSYETLTG